MTKTIFAIFLGLILLTGCAGLRIDKTATNEVLAYGAGKAMGIGVNRLVPQVDAELSASWSDMMQRSSGKEAVDPAEILLFYNDTIAIIGLHIDDPYGLTADLGVLLRIFGAQYDAQGAMVAIQPVPLEVMLFFEDGYKNGRRVALR